MSAVETLRKAADLLRQRAEGFITEDYTPPRVDIDREGTCDNCAQHKHLVASYPDDDSEPWLCAPCAAYTDYYATVDQEFGFAVIGLLDAIHRRCQDLTETQLHLPESVLSFNVTGYDEALAVARAVLGEDS